MLKNFKNEFIIKTPKLKIMLSIIKFGWLMSILKLNQNLIFLSCQKASL